MNTESKTKTIKVEPPSQMDTPPQEEQECQLVKVLSFTVSRSGDMKNVIKKEQKSVGDRSSSASSSYSNYYWNKPPVPCRPIPQLETRELTLSGLESIDQQIKSQVFRSPITSPSMYIPPYDTPMETSRKYNLPEYYEYTNVNGKLVRNALPSIGSFLNLPPPPINGQSLRFCSACKQILPAGQQPKKRGRPPKIQVKADNHYEEIKMESMIKRGRRSSELKTVGSKFFTE